MRMHVRMVMDTCASCPRFLELWTPAIRMRAVDWERLVQTMKGMVPLLAHGAMRCRDS